MKSVFLFGIALVACLVLCQHAHATTIFPDFDLHVSPNTFWTGIGGCGTGFDDMRYNGQSDAVDCALVVSAFGQQMQLSNGEGYLTNGNVFRGTPTQHVAGSPFTFSASAAVTADTYTLFASFTLTDENSFGTFDVTLNDNLGSDGNEVYIATSDGDNVPDVNDRWVLSRDTTFNDPMTMYIIEGDNDHANCQFGGNFNGVNSATCTLGPFTATGQTQSLIFIFRAFTSSPSGDNAAANAAFAFAANSASIVSSGVLDFLNPTELSTVRNYDFPLACNGNDSGFCHKVQSSLRYKLDRFLVPFSETKVINDNVSE